jgi:hypothetical protein
MRINYLYLTNFQGLRDVRFDFNGLNADIYGDNATGKTTVFNGLTWLLFDKASTGAKNFTPKTKSADGDEHHLEHCAEAGLILNDGQLLTLKKVYKESYKRKRGSAQEEFDGHVVEYFIDGVPVREKDYAAALNNLIGPDEQMKMLMMPDYFAEVVSWETRRKILLEMCGDICDADVINGTPELKDLPEYLAVPGAAGKQYTVEEFKKIAATSCAKINKDLESIPKIINEAKLAKPDVKGLGLVSIEAAINATNVLIDNKLQEKQQVLSGDANVDAIRKQITKYNLMLAEERSAYAEKSSKLNENTYKILNNLNTAKAIAVNNVNEMTNYLTAMKHKLESMGKTRQQLHDEYARVYAGTWQGSDVCPTCGQTLPSDAIAQAVAAFNTNRSNRLEEINKQGQTCSKSVIAALEDEIDKVQNNIQTANESINQINADISTAEQSLVKSKPFEETTVYLETMQVIAALQSDGSNADAVVSQQVHEIDTELSNLRMKLSALISDKSNITLATQQEERIESLNATEKAFSREYERLQRGINLCDEFIKAKVSMLTESINSRFDSVRFRLFINQINGGLKEDCEVMVPGDGRMVPYAFANNAARINAGLEIINALAAHWDMTGPVFVDNAESVTQLRPIASQLIRLIVSAPDKKLRMEIH